MVTGYVRTLTTKTHVDPLNSEILFLVATEDILQRESLIVLRVDHETGNGGLSILS